ncbi:hypothetical protein [Magnetospirillum sp. UT-4]|uniref:hypothetical protein n=1 Tax=Magnetospirillum sp. UT-4 TaxID=2681467 RepID=UPI00137E931E|nr:hypothetical protein [Magnetospirillum sp. UT-4]CAA7621190.1 exported hypothetical protein [Magnetospirillum sp. UT-4]
MGGRAGVILPLLALGAVGVATGGFGLAGAGAAAAEGAGAAAAAGAGAAEGLAAGTAAGELAAGAGAEILAGGAGADLLASDVVLSAAADNALYGSLASQAGMTGTELASAMTAQSMANVAPMVTTGVTDAAGLSIGGVMPAAPEAASGGFFTDLLGGPLIGSAKEGAVLGYGEAAGLGLTGAKAVGSAGQAAALASQQEAQLELQRKEAELAISERELASQQRLRKVLASQTVMFGALGVDPTTGSPAALASQAEADAENDMMSVRTDAYTTAAAVGLKRSGLRQARRGAMVGGLIDFGEGAWNVANYRRRIGA